MLNLYERTMELKPSMIENRRWLHKNAELGSELPKTAAFVRSELERIGCDVTSCGKNGLVALIGKTPGKTVLLRADMDALPMTEESGESFSCTEGNMHACGHDLHTAALLAAAKLLKEQEDTLCGTVKLMFQPAEEVFHGALDMLSCGVLDNPTVDYAFACHVGSDSDCGQVLVNPGAVMSACAGFKIKITGKGSHGAAPENGVDPISIGAHILTALQAMVSREAPMTKGALLTIGSFHAGTAANIIPDTAELSGTLRTFNNRLYPFLKQRMHDIVTMTAQAYRGDVEITMLSDIPVLVNDPDLSALAEGWMREMDYPGLRIANAAGVSGSEDFSYIAQKVPSVYFFVGAKPENLTGSNPLHGKSTRFNEDAIPIAAALMTRCAVRCLSV